MVIISYPARKTPLPHHVIFLFFFDTQSTLVWENKVILLLIWCVTSHEPSCPSVGWLASVCWPISENLFTYMYVNTRS